MDVLVYPRKVRGVGAVLSLQRVAQKLNSLFGDSSGGSFHGGELDDLAGLEHLRLRHAQILQIESHRMGYGLGARFGNDQPPARTWPHPRRRVVLEQADRFTQHRAADPVPGDELAFRPNYLADWPAPRDDVALDLMRDLLSQFAAAVATARQGVNGRDSIC